ncbi:MAG TPA: glycosyltransferase [Flavisolibacter sp.]|nr:glycosyltransferase [Flavisolibacter sp.]
MQSVLKKYGVKVQALNTISSRLRVLIFIGSLGKGGKERRLIEMLTYFKADDRFDFLVVLTKSKIQYQSFLKLGIPYMVIKRQWKKSDPTILFKFFKICNEFKPHLIHTWGRMQSFYALPASIYNRIPLVNSQITGAPTKLNRWSLIGLIDKVNFKFSKIILSNSNAGVECFKPPLHKARVIYNGINMNRFKQLPSVEEIKKSYGITTPYVVVMVAAFTYTKDYGLFYRVADRVTKSRKDICFIGVGGYRENDFEYRRLLDLSSHNPNILFPGAVENVEALVNACDIGVLFSTNGEGISNSIMEYMALGKPVVATDAGGMKELVRDKESGYLISNHTESQIAALITELIDDPEKRRSFGIAGKKIIEDYFSISKMGKAFEKVYEEALH